MSITLIALAAASPLWAQPLPQASAPALRPTPSTAAPSKDAPGAPNVGPRDLASRAGARDLRSIPGGQIKRAGTYHVATGTWTRPGNGSSRTSALGGPAGSDVVYSNTSETGVFTVGIGSLSFPGQITYDEGVLPTPANFTPGLGTQPDRGIYEITAFDIQYCDMDSTPMSSGWTYTFYESFDPIGDPAMTGVPAAAVVALSGLPSNGCWSLTVDLTGGSEFSMRGDGAPLAAGWQDELARDSFGIGIEYTSAQMGADAGIVLAGDPDYTGGIGGFGAGTYFIDPSEAGTACGTTGFGAQDGFTIVLGPQIVRTPSQYSNGTGCGMASLPYASAYMKLYATEGPGTSVGSSYCVANANATGSIARMSAVGSTIAATDKLRLEVSNMPLNTFGFFLTSRTAGFSVMPAGSQGNLCLDGVIGRFDDTGQIQSSGPAGIISIDSTAGQWSVLAQPLGGQVLPAMAGERWHYTAWYRDIVGGSPTSNFADGLFIDFN